MSDTSKQSLDTTHTEPIRAYGFTFQSAVDLLLMPPAEWRVESVLPTSGLAVIFGASGAGKSFLWFDLVAAIAEGGKWFGYSTKPCRILCMVLEGYAGLRQRIRAWEEHNERKYPDSVYFVKDEFALNNDDSVGNLQSAIKVANGFDIVVIDTLNRAAPGADENSSTAMSKLIEAANKLQKTTGGLVVFIHHSGKDEGRGMRGHGSLHAATDSVIELKRYKENEHGWKLIKSKDSEDGATHSFRLTKIEFDEEAGLGSSLAVEPLGSASEAFNRSVDAKPKGKNQVIVLERISLMLTNSTQYGQGGASQKTPCVKIKNLLDLVKADIPAPSDRQLERAKDALKALVKTGLIRQGEDWLWKP